MLSSCDLKFYDVFLVEDYHAKHGTLSLHYSKYIGYLLSKNFKVVAETLKA